MSQDLGWIDMSQWLPGDPMSQKPAINHISSFVTRAIGSSTVLVAEMPMRSLAMMRRVLCFQLEDMTFTLDSPALMPGACASVGWLGCRDA